MPASQKLPCNHNQAGSPRVAQGSLKVHGQFFMDKVALQNKKQAIREVDLEGLPFSVNVNGSTLQNKV